MKKGIAAAPGTGVGRAAILQQRVVPHICAGADPVVPGTLDNELERFRRGRAVAVEYYRSLVERVRTSAGEEEAEIFEGHLEILTGEDLEEAVEEAIGTRHVAAEAAIRAFAVETAREFEELDSEYFRQRAGDIRDIGDRLAEAVYFGSIADSETLAEESVVVAEELTPSATARLDTDRVVAIATEKGGRTSHAAILARALSIPCVTGVEGLVRSVRNGQWLVVDGDAGTVETDVDPDRDRELLKRLAERRQAERDRAEQRRAWSREHEARTADGTSVSLAANVSGTTEAALARELGVHGSGLVRSEFFFMRFSDFPAVEQQVAEYREICRILAPHPVVIRLLDCGADKPLPYARQKQEDNPFLGERGIRLLMNRPEQLRAQVEAISRVAQEGYAIKLMVPMVVTPEEVLAVRDLVTYRDLPVGMMVETPASVLALDRFTETGIVDFVSIGSNDLVQYVMAVDRGNAAVAHLSEELHPAVLAAIAQVVRLAHGAGIPVGVCGDMASRPDTALALLALGVDSLSAGISAVPEVKAAISVVTTRELQELGEVLRTAPDAATARAATAVLADKCPAPWEQEVQ
ncbi:MAG: phosphoenolpyruvate--protein phosphotransferase [Spirochaetaceae bacterium]|nr:MAG: phosphoenolpyruvate--protein phosphotransferase [Spirochaetaceae bacterium]